MTDGRSAIFKTYLFRAVVIAAVVAFCVIYYGLLTGKEIFVHDSIIWYGSFHYYVESLLSGHFPYWDPYLMTGSYFYPNISHHGLLDPLVLFGVFIRKITGISALTIYLYFRILRLVILALGAFFFYRHITKSGISALLAAVILFFALPPGYFKQYGAVDVIYLTPLALYFLLLFFEADVRRKKYLYLACLVLISGVSMNVYIPAYYLFNLFAFLLVIFLLGIVSFKEFAVDLHSRKLQSALAAAIVMVAMMAAPPLMVMTRDASGGELFPILRIAQKNDGNLKRIVASEVKSSSLSGRFYDQKGVFDSYGNVVNLLYPEMWNIPFFAEHDFMAEINQYIGLIPLIFCILAILYAKSRYRWLSLIMLALITINMFSFEGMSGHPYNALQKVFNGIFPPLKMIDVRETLTAFSLFYLCALVSMGLKLLFGGEEFREIARLRYRQILSVGIIIIMLKIAITGYFGRKVIFASLQDLYAIAQVVFFILLIFLYSRRSATKQIVCLLLVSIIFADLFLYNYLYKRDMLMDRRPLDAFIETGYKPVDHFQYFREPIASPPGLAFGESITKVKGVLTYGNNHSIFSTKRYYDILTHVPFENQLALSGVIYPVVRFFPIEKVLLANDRKLELDYLVGAEDSRLTESIVIEKKGLKASAKTGDLESLAQYEDVKWLQPASLLFSVEGYMRQHRATLGKIRGNRGGLLQTAEYSLDVKQFTPNGIVLQANTSADGYLLYNDGWSKYWEAYDNDRRIPVEIANYNSKAVFLSKGEHTVRFVFNPVHYKVGLVLYYAGLLCAVGMIIFFYIKCGITPAEVKEEAQG